MSMITILGTDASEYRVVCGESAAEKYAAEQLKCYFGKLGAIPDGDKGVIELKLDPNAGFDGWHIKNSAGTLSIEGGNGRGVIYGVYALLEKYLGFRAFMPGLEKLSGGDIPECDDSFKPVFEYRQSDWPCGNDTVWSAKNNVNSRPCGDELGGFAKWGGFVHTMHDLTDTPYDKQPCLSDPENLKKAIARVRKMLENDPTLSIISVSQNDNCNYCKCEKCAAVDEEEGSHMGTLLRFVNAVADNIKDDYPNVAIETLAYQYTRRPPKHVRPLPNVIIRLCSIECCFAHPLSDETCGVNRAFRTDIEDWNKICDRMYIWDYVTDFSYYIPPFPNFGVLRENMRFFALHGVKGMYPEGNYNSVSGEFGELRCWLLAKLMWNPLMSETEYQAYMDEFLEAYYGAGWRYIRAFIDFTVSESKHSHMVIWNPPFNIVAKEMYEAMYDTIESWWNSAEEMAGDKLENVRRSRMQWSYVTLMLRPDAEKGKRFFEDAQKYNVKFNEWRPVTKTPDFSQPVNEWDF